MERYKNVKIASILGIIGNLFLFIIKIIVGLLTKSQAMIADAFNSGSDVFASLMTFVGNRIASKPSDDDHNLGHGKAEYVYSLFISLIMALMGIIILKKACFSIFNNQQYNFSFWLIIVCLITIIIKLLLFFYTDKLAKMEHNLLVEANSKDHLNDCIVTFGNLIASLFTLIDIYWVDGVIGSLIAIWMLIISIRIFKESYDVLMDKSISNDTKDKVYAIIKKYPEVKRVIHFNSTPVGYRYQISFTIYVNGNLSTFDSHKIADNLEKEIGKEIHEIYLTVIHVNPFEERS